MYCVKCGVELEKGETVCPLCQTEVYHPVLGDNSGKKSYPISKVPTYETVNKTGILFIITVAFLIIIFISLMCDINITGGVSWSGYVMGGALLLYVISILPSWFKKPNPVIFVPVSFASAEVFLLYISMVTNGGWFLSFAFPAGGAIGLIITAIVAICHYVKKGYWFVAGGGVIAIGGYCVLIEFLIAITFGFKTHFPWSLYPLTVCLLLGGALLVIAVSQPLRRSIQKRFFI